MRKTGKFVILSWILIAALALGLSAPISLRWLHNTEVSAQTTDDTDGVYTIEGRLWHATMDQPSMGNSAITQPMKIVKNGDDILLQMEFHSLSSGVFSGYLYSIHYFPSWNHEDEVPVGEKAIPITVTEYYDGIYDEYNHLSDGLDEEIRGMLYPHYAVMPMEWNAASTWVQVYVPVMEAISAGSGRQYARLQLDWDTLEKTEENVEDITTSPADTPSGDDVVPTPTAVPPKTTPAATHNKNSSGNNSKTGEKKLKINSLEDGTYTIAGKMLKPDKKSKSMANEALDHSVILTVKKGKYSLTVSFSGLTVGSSKGYLSRMKYFKAGYKKDKNGIPAGNKAAVTIKTYQKDSSGRKLSDYYGTDYPAKVTFPMIAEAKKDGYVPLQVFVPIMEAISAGTGEQPVYLKLDLSSITSGKKSTKTNTKTSTSNKKSSSDSSKTSNNSPNSSVSSSSAAATTNTVSTAENAVKGTVYSCQVVPSYKHPVTGKVEDSGGTSSYAAGQGMVESVMGNSGMLEETENGEYYLTVRISLMDLTSGHKFWTQKKGESVWQSVSQVITQTGSDKNGKTSDFCFAVPDKDSIIKTSMHVEPMGRDVVFYAYLKNLKEGQPEDMNATKVTADAAGAAYDSQETEKTEEDSEDLSSELSEDEELSTLSDTGLSSAQGLSLSTAGAGALDSTETDGSNTIEGSGTREMSLGKWILVLTLSMTLSGLLLMSAGAGLVYYFRRNWFRWGEEMEDDKD